MGKGNRQFEVMFNRRANLFEDYSKDTPILDREHPTAAELQQKMNDINNLVFPALKAEMAKQQKIDNDNFMKSHKIRHEPFPLNAQVMIRNINKAGKTDPMWEGPSIHNIVRLGSYVLKDSVSALYSRNVPTSHIKLSHPCEREGNLNHFEVQSIIDHQGENPSEYLYRVRWKDYTH